MTNLSDIIKDPNYVNANPATKKAIFEKYSATDSNYTDANKETQTSIREKFGVAPKSVGILEGLARSTASGAALGFGEEAEAKVRSIGGDRSYEDNLADLRERQKTFSREHPYLDLAGNLVGGIAAPLAVAAGAAALPEIAGVAGAAALASRVIPGAAKVAQLASKSPMLANVVKGAATNAGVGGVAGFGSGEGGFQERMKSAGEGVLIGGALGAALPAAGKVIQLGAQGVRDIVRPFTASGRENIAKRVMQGLPGSERIVSSSADEFVPGYKPTLAETTESRDLAEVQKSLLGKDVTADKLAESKEALQKYALQGQSGDVAAPFSLKQGQYQSALEAAEKEAAATVTARGAAASGAVSQAQQSLNKLKSPVEKLTSEISETAKAKLDDTLDKVREHESSLWSPFSDASKPVPFTARGKFQETIADHKVSLDGIEMTYVPKEIWKQLSGLESKTTFDKVQRIRSAVLAIARDASETNLDKKRVLNELADVINDGVVKASTPKGNLKGGAGLSEDMLGQWNSARAATANRAKVFGNPIVKGLFKENTKQAAPEEFFKRVLTGDAKKTKFEKLQEMLDPFNGLTDDVRATIPKETLDAVNVNKSSLMQDLQEHLASDLGKKAEKEGSFYGKGLEKWRSGYEDLFKARPELDAKFGSTLALHKAASDALDFASTKVNEREVGKLSKFFSVDPNDTKAISGRIKSVINSGDENSVLNVVKELGEDQDAIGGLKRGFLDTILESNKPHDFILDNKDKLHQLFSSASDKKLLKTIEDGFRMSETLGAGGANNNEAIKKLLGGQGFLPILLDKVGSRLATGTTMIAGGLLGTKFLGPLAVLAAATGAGAGAIGVPSLTRMVLQGIYNAPREKVVNLLKEAFKDPAEAKKLMKPIEQWTYNSIPKSIKHILGPDINAAYGRAGLATKAVSSYVTQKTVESEKKAVGGLASLKKRYG
jgi:hypothetical protein